MEHNTPIISLPLTLVLIKGLSRRRFRVVVRREEREELCRTALSVLTSRRAAADRAFGGSGWQLNFLEGPTTLTEFVAVVRWRRGRRRTWRHPKEGETMPEVGVG